MVSITTRARLPSFDVQKETRAALQAASVCNKLPAAFSGLGNFVVSEKNTFINIEPKDSMESDCDLDLSCEETDELSPVFPARVSVRKNTDVMGGVSVNGIHGVSDRRMSHIPSCRIRRKSCPPDIAVPEHKLVNSHPTNSSSATTTRTTTPRSTVYPVSPSTPPRPPAVHHIPNRGRYYSMDVLSTPPSSGGLTISSLKPVDETVTTVSPSSSPSTPGDDDRTTIMLRNVPYGECQVGVLELIKSKGFGGKFNFFYAPLDFNSGNNLGYAFINFFHNSDVAEFFQVFDGLRVERDGGWGQKELQVCWARVQGLDPNVEHYRNSPVNDMPEQFRPMVFKNDGTQLPFPRPDENVPRRPIPASSFYGQNKSSNRPRFGSAQFGTGGRTKTRTPSGSFSVVAPRTTRQQQ